MDYRKRVSFINEWVDLIRYHHISREKKLYDISDKIKKNFELEGIEVSYGADFIYYLPEPKIEFLFDYALYLFNHGKRDNFYRYRLYCLAKLIKQKFKNPYPCHTYWKGVKRHICEVITNWVWKFEVVVLKDPHRRFNLKVFSFLRRYFVGEL